MHFKDRHEAGQFLAQKLTQYANREDVLVLALPRGGVPVGATIATALNLRLDVFIVRKLGVPGHAELAMGAIASGGTRVLNESIVRRLQISSESINSAIAREQAELERREKRYRDGRPPLDVKNRTVILVDDGLATGASMKSAVEALRKSDPARIIVAVPVGARETCEDLEKQAEVVCVLIPEPFQSVGEWFLDFTQTTDEEVSELLSLAR